MSSFRTDKLENENKDPTESSSLKFIYVPLMLLSAFIGFGATFLALRTPEVSMEEGDSRVHADAGSAALPTANNGLAALLEKGKRTYTTSCQACHQANGAGIPGAFPPLEGSEWVTGSQKRLAAIVLHGINGEINVKGQKFRGVMPSFAEQLKPDEIAAVATYARQTFGKKEDIVPTALVQAIIEQTKSRTAPWAGESELNAQKWE